MTRSQEAPYSIVENTVRKLRVSLAHPSSADLARVMRHGGATENAVKAARALKRDVCDSLKKPKVLLVSRKGEAFSGNAVSGVEHDMYRTYKVSTANRQLPLRLSANAPVAKSWFLEQIDVACKCRTLRTGLDNQAK